MGNAFESALQSIFQLGNAPSNIVQALQDQGTLGTELMIVVGFVLLGYSILYHIIDSPSKNKKSHLWTTILLTAASSASMTLFYIPYSIDRGLQAASQAADMSLEGGLDLPTVVTSSFPILGAVPSAIAAFLVTVVLFAVIVQSPWPRRLSVNCRSLRII